MRVIHITNTYMYLTKYLYVLGLYKMNICKLRKMSFEPNIYQEHLLCGFRLITKQQKQSNVRVQCTTSCPVTYRRHKPDSMIYKKKRRCDSQREAIFFQYFWIWGLNNEVEETKGPETREGLKMSSASSSQGGPIKSSRGISMLSRVGRSPLRFHQGLVWSESSV